MVVCQNVPLAVVDDARPNTGGHDKRLVELARLDFLLVGDLDHCRLDAICDVLDCGREITRRGVRLRDSRSGRLREFR